VIIGGFPKRHLDDPGIKLIQVNFRLFTDYISRRIGEKIILEPVASFDELRRKLKSRSLDFVWAWSSIESVKIWDEFPITPFIALDPMNDGVKRKGYRYLLITRSDNNCEKIDDLEGKTLLYLNSEDGLYKNISLLFVDAFLKKHGKDINKFFKLSRYGNDDVKTSNIMFEYGPSRDLILRVLSNPDVAASVNEEAYLIMAKRNPKIREMIKIIAATDPFPPSPYFVWKDSDQKLLKKIKDVLLNMNKDPEGQEILKTVRIGAWVDVDASNYDALRNLMADVNKFGIKAGQ
jgi:ABC-type phosphate/phosphonate transport system substrate-binding protein